MAEKSKGKKEMGSTDIAAELPTGKPMRRKVVATQLGFYNHIRRRPGDQFYLNDGVKHFSCRWMMDVAEWKAQKEAEAEAAAEAEASKNGDGVEALESL